MARTTRHPKLHVRTRPTVERLEDRLALTAGGLDPTFGTGGVVLTDFDGATGEASAVAVQSDGKLLVGGRRDFGGASSSFALARYQSNGQLDSTFSDQGLLFFDGQAQSRNIEDIAIQADGKIVVVGGDGSDFVVYRFNGDGSPDDGLETDTTPDNSFGAFGSMRIDFSGFADTPYAVSIYPASSGALAGKIIVAGETILNGTASSPHAFGLVRLNGDGTVDATFGDNGKAVTELSADSRAYAQDVLVLPGGEVVAAGFTQPLTNNAAQVAVIQYTTAGNLDTRFSGDGKFVSSLGFSRSYAAAVARQPDGKLVLAGGAQATTNFTTQNFLVARLTSAGDLDPSFGTAGVVSTDFAGNSDGASEVAIQSDGRIVVGGGTVFAPGDFGFGLVRYQSSGSLDTSFGDGGRVVTNLGGADNSSLNALALDPASGKIVAVGSTFTSGFADTHFAVVRYLTGDAPADDDVDGISDTMENGAPNNGDGNSDGVPDRLQANVTSLPNAVDQRYLTLVSAAGTRLADVSVQPPQELPNGVELPLGSISFTVLDVAPGGTTDVQVLFPAAVRPSAYYRFGPTPDNHTPHWYPFGREDDIGARIDLGRVTLTFVDGGFGDDDLTADGRIVDGGGLAQGNLEISGVVFNDLNADGDRDEGEPAAPTGWQLYLDLNTNGVFDGGDYATETAADGSYRFTGLAPERYFVQDVDRRPRFLRDGPPPVPSSRAGYDFEAVSSSALFPAGDQLISADLNGDGLPDLATVLRLPSLFEHEYRFSLNVDANTGNPGSFTPLSSFLFTSAFLPVAPYSLLAQDLNRDGLIDLVIYSESEIYFTVFLNSSGSPGTFNTLTSYPLPQTGRPTGMVATDVDADGLRDLVAVASSSSPLLFFRNNPTRPGTFLEATTLGEELYDSPLQQGDLNRDGRPDVVTHESGFPSLAFLLSDATSSIGYRSATLDYPPDRGVVVETKALVVADLNDDGLDDIALAGRAVAGHPLYVFLNDPNQPGTLRLSTSLSFDRNTNSMAAGDFNGDGLLDLAVMHMSKPLVSLLLNNPLAPGTFADPVLVQPNAEIGPTAGNQIAVADFDVDGQLDFAYVGDDFRSGQRTQFDTVRIVYRLLRVDDLRDGNSATVNLGIRFPRDLDVDFVADAVEDGAPNNGDGNNDGIADSQQDDVTSLPNAVDGAYLTLEVLQPSGGSLLQVVASATPEAALFNDATRPSGVFFPFGFLEFKLNVGLPAGGAGTVRLTVEGTPLPTGSFWKFGATPDNATPHWYEFNFDGTTGAEINGNQVTLHFVDGRRGDNGPANGVIDDPGGLAFVRAPEVSVVVNDGTAQRARVTGLTVTFNQLVTVRSGAFVLRKKDGTLVGLRVALAEVAGQTVAQLTFKGTGIVAGSLADGRYTLKIKAAKIRNDAGLSLSSNVVDTFFRRFGDADGDNDVDATDAALFDSAFGTRQGDAAFLAYFDYNGDGVLDVKDRRQLNRRLR